MKILPFATALIVLPWLVVTAATAEPSLTETRWQLVELNGKPVEVPTEERPYFVLRGENQRLEGFGGCNRIMGGYELGADGALTIPPVASTRMACPNAEAEWAFIKLLEVVKSYVITDGTLVLSSDDSLAAAKFVAVPDHE